MYGILDISTSGMIAQRERMAVIASNIANRNAMIDVNGNPEPYRARRVIFAPGNPGATTERGRAMGVHVAGVEVDDSPLTPRWDPGNPFAHRTGKYAGYVMEPQVNTVVEQINALEATRAYEANATVAEATKQMVSQVLRLLA